MSEDANAYRVTEDFEASFVKRCLGGPDVAHSGDVVEYAVRMKGASVSLPVTYCKACAAAKAHQGFVVEPILANGYTASAQKPIDPKGDAGALKTPLGLIPPVAEKAMAEVLKLGAQKYGIRNWRTTCVKESTYVNALLRHLNAYSSGEAIDPESGQSHLAHVMSGCAILLDAAANGTLEHDLQLTEVKTP